MTTIRVAWIAVTAAGFALAPQLASAHQVWLEQDGKGGRLYFGEYGHNLREVSPGRLDKFSKLTATHLSPKGEHVMPVAKQADAFAVPARARQGESLIVQDPEYPLLDRKDPAKPGKSVRTAWTPAARFVSDLGPQPAKLDLDVVPTGKPGEFQVWFRGQPLAEAKVDVIAASGWSRQGETDSAGKVSFSLPWKSGYLVKVNHVEDKPGKRRTARGEESYDAASFATTLSFSMPSGLPAPPSPPPAKPREMAAN